MPIKYFMKDIQVSMAVHFRFKQNKINDFVKKGFLKEYYRIYITRIYDMEIVQRLK